MSVSLENNPTNSQPSHYACAAVFQVVHGRSKQTTAGVGLGWAD